MLSDHKPFLLVVSAPSGCGKTTLLKALFDRVSGLGMSISHTTRQPRAGERNGVDYHFVDTAEFSQMLSAGQFLEHATVHENLYGTSTSSIHNQLQNGLDVVLDIDVQGMALVKAASQFDIVSLFILPPSIDELEKRLRKRNTDSDAVIERRLTNAVKEIMLAGKYDYLLMNQDFNFAADNLVSIVLTERLRASRSFLLSKYF